MRSALLPLACLALLASGSACRDVPVQSASRSPDPPTPAPGIAARGRLAPKGRVLRIAGPSDFVTVVASLRVAEGDPVEAGQVLAVMDTRAERSARTASLGARLTAQQAALVRAEAELENARLEDVRRQRLSTQGILADTERDASTARLNVARAAVDEARAQIEATRADRSAAEAEAERAVVRAPRAGRILRIHARPGEKVGPEGILELGATDVMYAIAEVYETDAPRVAVGQKARIRSPALPRELSGTVEHVGLQVGRLGSLGTDPNARSDARVVEVEIRLDDSADAGRFTDLEVEVVISGA